MATATEAAIPRVRKPRKASIRAILALDNVVANGGSMADALRGAGFSEAIARNPQKVTGTDAFRALLEKHGLTESFLTKALVEDIKAKKRNRKPELELGYKVLGRLKEREEPGGNIINLNFFNEDQLRKVASRTVNGSPASEAQPD